jgi:hypothetical protein
MSLAYSLYRPKQLLYHYKWLSHYWTAGSSYEVVSSMQYKICSWIESWYLCFQSNLVCFIAVTVALNAHMSHVGDKWTIHLLNHGCSVLLWHTDFVEPFIFVVNVYNTIWRTHLSSTLKVIAHVSLIAIYNLTCCPLCNEIIPDRHDM